MAWACSAASRSAQHSQRRTARDIRRRLPMASNALSREAQPLQELRVTLVRAQSFQYRVDFHERQAAVVLSIELRARTASFKWQVSPLLLYSLPWHRARTEPSRKVSCQSASCRATLFGGSREKCFAFRSRSVDGTEYVTGAVQPRKNALSGSSR